ncbi:CubicO group peptidase, beta-lactamase class C family [Chryseobacterium soldanellicola]|uniref:CubicO group peptidase, beta-lactamase class C family n=1 Tax=Chryseobacterium soldanellicola TaxID=311333 RepID=A0A1H1FVJ4_9FLAO|nr:serine hydrolase domain-containing protein [Chryseobacterium soldanellicola]SDR04738.1 CubicO group peptidase, beta-lactamase class C family [Chryseobacterium soldanellicola]
MKTFLAIVFSFLMLTGSFAQEAQMINLKISTDNPMRNRLDSLIDQRVKTYFKDKRAVGLSLGVVISGKTSFYNYGETAQGNQILPSETTLYEIGSMTKTFTGILLAQAVLDKKVALDDDIRKYIKGDYPNLTYKGTPIRIRDLANHTSRITRIFPNLWERKNYKEDNPYSDYTRQLLYQGLHEMKMDTIPGSLYSYSNMAVGLLGCILEDAYKEQYFNLISRYILSPLKMESTRINLTGIPPKGIAYPHNANREVVPFWDVPELPALGALRSNTMDMVKYIIANNAEKLQPIALSHKPTFGNAREGMGMNWFIHTTPEGYQVFEHSGGTGGSRSSLQCLPKLNSGFVLLSNSLADRNGLEKELLAIVQTR